MTRPTESPADELFRMAAGYRSTAALYVVAKLGVADVLVRGPARAEELAAELGAHPRSLFRVLRALAAQGVFTQDSSDQFGLTPLSRLLVSDSPGTMRFVSISFGEEHYKAAGDLMHTVMTGETAFNHLYGKGFFDYLAENKEASQVFNKFMIQNLERQGNPFESYDFKGRTFVVDVGGGQGAVIGRILRSNPRLKGMLYDLPQGLADAPGYLRGLGVLERCKIVPGSFFESIPKGGDAYLMSRILHDWPDEKASLILANCRKAVGKGGILLIREAVIPDGGAPSAGKQIDLTMLFLLGGVERTEPEWNRLLHDAGFSIKRISKTGETFDIIEAYPV